MPDISIEKNFNNKADNDLFIHIAKAPEVVPSPSKLEKTTFRLVFKDGSHNPVMIRIRDIDVKKAKYITPLESLMSHAMTTNELIEFLFLNKQTINPIGETELAVYWCERIAGDS